MVMNGDEWVHYWFLWQQDSYWMWILHTANADWRLWSSALGMAGTFEKDGNLIRLRVIGPDKQGKNLDLWQFHGNGGIYELLNLNNLERPVDPFVEGGYYQPLIDYYTIGKATPWRPYGYQYISSTLAVGTPFTGYLGAQIGFNVFPYELGQPNTGLPIGDIGTGLGFTPLPGAAYVSLVTDIAGFFFEVRPMVSDRINRDTSNWPSDILPLVPGNGPQ
jgi:hypothetical protein